MPEEVPELGLTCLAGEELPNVSLGTRYSLTWLATPEAIENVSNASVIEMPVLVEIGAEKVGQSGVLMPR